MDAISREKNGAFHSSSCVLPYAAVVLTSYGKSACHCHWGVLSVASCLLLFGPSAFRHCRQRISTLI